MSATIIQLLDQVEKLIQSTYDSDIKNHHSKSSSGVAEFVKRANKLIRKETLYLNLPTIKLYAISYQIKKYIDAKSCTITFTDNSATEINFAGIEKCNTTDGLYFEQLYDLPLGYCRENDIRELVNEYAEFTAANNTEHEKITNIRDGKMQKLIELRKSQA